MKKGQVTLFFILGIVIVIVIGSMLVLSSNNQGAKLPSDTKAVQQFVEQCLKETTSTGIALIAWQGGTIIVPQFPGGVEHKGFTASYGYFEGVNMLPSKEEILVVHLEPWVEDHLDYCINDFSAFSGSIIAKERVIETEYTAKGVLVNMNWPIEIANLGSKSTLEKFQVEIPLKLGELMDYAHELVEKQIEEPLIIDTLYLNSLPIDWTLDRVTPRENVLELRSGDLEFFLGMKYTLNLPPMIFPLQNGNQGQRYSTIVGVYDPENEAVTFSDDSSEFEMRADGVIDFTPSKIGVVTITVTDSAGNKDTESFEVEG